MRMNVDKSKEIGKGWGLLLRDENRISSRRSVLKRNHGYYRAWWQLIGLDTESWECSKLDQVKYFHNKQTIKYSRQEYLMKDMESASVGSTMEIFWGIIDGQSEGFDLATFRLFMEVDGLIPNSVTTGFTSFFSSLLLNCLGQTS